MLNPSDNEETFTIDGHRVEVEFKSISGEVIAAIRDAIRKDEYGSAEILLLGGAIDRLTHDSKTIIRPSSRSSRRAGTARVDAEGIPNDYDSHTDELLVDKLLKLAVSKTPWMAIKEPFSDVFAQYADEDVPEKDPTVSPPATKTGS